MVLLAPLVSVVEPPAQLTSVRMVAMPQQFAVVLQQLVVSPAQMASGQLVPPPAQLALRRMMVAPQQLVVRSA